MGIYIFPTFIYIKNTISFSFYRNMFNLSYRAIMFRFEQSFCLIYNETYFMNSYIFASFKKSNQNAHGTFYSFVKPSLANHIL